VRTVLETNLRRFEEEALTKGRLEGELQKAREVARKLKESGVDPAIIAESTGLSAEELKQL
jgi:predicted transposase/invertase (TIGR01784 family)